MLHHGIKLMTTGCSNKSKTYHCAVKNMTEGVNISTASESPENGPHLLDFFLPKNLQALKTAEKHSQKS